MVSTVCVCSLCALLQVSVSCLGDLLINNLPVRNFHYCSWCQTAKDLQWVSLKCQSNFGLCFFFFFTLPFGCCPWGQLILQTFSSSDSQLRCFCLIWLVLFTGQYHRTRTYFIGLQFVCVVHIEVREMYTVISSGHVLNVWAFQLVTKGYIWCISYTLWCHGCLSIDFMLIGSISTHPADKYWWSVSQQITCVSWEELMVGLLAAQQKQSDINSLLRHFCFCFVGQCRSFANKYFTC